MVREQKATAGAGQHAGFGELRKVFKIREVRLMFPIWLIVATLLGIALTYLPIILLSRNIKGATIGIMFAGAGVVLGLLQPFWGKVSDIVGRIPVMAYGIFSMLGIILMVLLAPGWIYYQDASGVHFNLIGAIPFGDPWPGGGGVRAIGFGAHGPLRRMPVAYGATMGLYSFALGFGAFMAETLGLLIILATGKEDAPSWLLYFAAVLIGMAVIMMLYFFLTRGIEQRLRPERKKE